MPGSIAKSALLALVLVFVLATAADAQTLRHRRQRPAAEPPPPVVPVDKRDSLIAAPGAFSGRPYWLALAQCGGIYFKLNMLYTDAALRARVLKPDPKANADFTSKLNDAIRTATTYFDAAEDFLMSERAIERPEAVLTYDPLARAAGERLKSIEAALAAARACPALYRTCRETHPKQCDEPLSPAS